MSSDRSRGRSSGRIRTTARLIRPLRRGEIRSRLLPCRFHLRGGFLAFLVAHQDSSVPVQLAPTGAGVFCQQLPVQDQTPQITHASLAPLRKVSGRVSHRTG